MKRRAVTLYNVIFPIWLLVLFPLTWLVVIPLNLLVDSLVICFSLKKYQVQPIKEIYKKTIFKIVCFGFLSDIIGGLWMLLPSVMPLELFTTDAALQRSIITNFVNPIMYNPFESVFSLLWVLVAMLIASACIYGFNRKFTFQNLSLAAPLAKKLSLILAIVTTPVLFLLPTMWFY